MDSTRRKKIGELLLERRIIDSDKLDKGLKHQKDSGKLLGECLIELGYLTEDVLTQTLAVQLEIPYISLKHYTLDPKLVALLPADIIRNRNILPLDRIGRITTVAACDVLNEEVVAELEKHFQTKIKYFLATVSDLKQAIDKYFLKNK
jgi:type IV pilus assembly protein PilB